MNRGRFSSALPGWTGPCSRRLPGEMFDRYGFVMCEAGGTKEPEAIFQRHQLKGAKEQGFSHLLIDLDSHHPPLKLIGDFGISGFGLPF
jgi:hypothetical protein